MRTSTRMPLGRETMIKTLWDPSCIMLVETDRGNWAVQLSGAFACCARVLARVQ